MNNKERVLLAVLTQLPDRNARAAFLQSFMAEEGPLSEEVAVKVRELMQIREKMRNE
jgi:hypothetical protein